MSYKHGGASISQRSYIAWKKCVYLCRDRCVNVHAPAEQMLALHTQTNAKLIVAFIQPHPTLNAHKTSP